MICQRFKNLPTISYLVYDADSWADRFTKIDGCRIIRDANLWVYRLDHRIEELPDGASELDKVMFTKKRCPQRSFLTVCGI